MRKKIFNFALSTYKLSITELVRIVRAKTEYSPLMRVAALRNLIASASIEITGGRCCRFQKTTARKFRSGLH